MAKSAVKKKKKKKKTKKTKKKKTKKKKKNKTRSTSKLDLYLGKKQVKCYIEEEEDKEEEEENSFHRQTGPLFKQETSIVLHMEHSFMWW